MDKIGNGWLLALIVFASTGYSSIALSDEALPTTDSVENRYTHIIDQKDRLQVLLRLIKQDLHEEVYELGQKWIEDLEGETWFDFYYGLSALKTGHYDQALFAFERLVIGNSSHTRYRLELARTHYYLQNLSLAKQEFQTVLNQQPPEPVKRNVLQFLKSIERLEKSFLPSFNGSASIAYGYDSNINSGSDSDLLPKEELVFPVDIILNEESQETASQYCNALLSLFYSHPISKRQAYNLKANYTKRENDKTTTYDLDSFSAEAGYAFQRSDKKYRAAITWQNTHLDHHDFVTNFSFSAQVQWHLASEYVTSIGINQNNSEYAENNTNNLTSYALSTSLASTPKKHNWLASLSISEDHADNSDFKYIGKNSYSLSFQVNSFWKNNISSTILINYVNSHYHDINSALYTRLRKDDTWNTAAGISYKLDKNFNLQNNYSYSINDSSLSANGFRKGKVELGINYIF